MSAKHLTHDQAAAYLGVCEKTLRSAERVRIREASLITGLDIRTLQEKAARGEIPGAEKPFGRWTFDVAKLRLLRSKGRTCAGSIKEAGFTGRVSRFAATNIGEAYEHVLSRSRSVG